MPFVSVIIPTFNRLSLLKRAVGSVLSQTHKDIELIIIDNYSSDGTQAYIDSLQDRRIKMGMTKNYGVIAKSRNLGLTMATGEYIAFLDSDDYWAEKKVANSLIAINRGFDFVYHDLFRVENNANIQTAQILRTSNIGDSPLSDLLLRGNVINTSSVVCRAKCFNEVSFVESEQFVGIEDYLCWLDIAAAGYRFCRIKQPLGGYGIGQNLSNDIRTIDLMRETFNKINNIPTQAHSTKIYSWPIIEMGISFYRLSRFQCATSVLLEGLKGSLHLRTRVKGIFFWCLSITRRLISD